MSVPSLARKVAEKNPLPQGAGTVAGGLIILGISIYAFLVITARILGDHKYASLAGLWSVVFLLAPGFFFPVEQEISRALSEREAKGEGTGSLIDQAAKASAFLVTVLVGSCLILRSYIVDEFFHGEEALFYGLILAICVYGAMHVGRGVLSGRRRFGGYAFVYAAEGTLRLLAVAVAYLVGANTAGPYGFLVGGAPLVAMILVFSRQRGLITPGPAAPWTELTQSIGNLLLGSVFYQVLVNGSAVAVLVLSNRSQRALAGHFISGLLISRVPLFLFQAVQAALLPRLTGLATEGHHVGFRFVLRRLMLAVSAISMAGVIGAALAGPEILRLLFGPEFDLSRRDLVLLAAGNSALMFSLALGQALLALSAHGLAVLGWFVGVMGFFVGLLFSDDLLLRAEFGLLAGASSAAASMAVLVSMKLRTTSADDAEPLFDAMEPWDQIVEP